MVSLPQGGEGGPVLGILGLARGGKVPQSWPRICNLGELGEHLGGGQRIWLSLGDPNGAGGAEILRGNPPRAMAETLEVVAQLGF